MPDFTETEGFRDAFVASLTVPSPPEEMLAFVADEPLHFPPGTQYRYSNSDNIMVGLMVQAATGRTYEEALAAQVRSRSGSAGRACPGPEMPAPFIHGYDVVPTGARGRQRTRCRGLGLGVGRHRVDARPTSTASSAATSPAGCSAPRSRRSSAAFIPGAVRAAGAG